ncbi:MAG: hypothetical protein CME62_07905 [Halobacteriovoraceae bacterium]|nr:hypothetical protein [Halobacteriovoraceae bacterium]|tara:strand:+ start:211 stop:516 length:306 start_codon:yes stop_codon:yes gene_type:complete
MKALALIPLFLFVLACGRPQEIRHGSSLGGSGDISGFSAVEGVEYTGLTYQGQEKSCFAQNPNNTMCTQVESESLKFAKSCHEYGNLAIQCDCHDWICVQK